MVIKSLTRTLSESPHDSVSTMIKSILAAVTFCAGPTALAQPVVQEYDFVYKVSVQEDNKLYINVRSGAQNNPVNVQNCSRPFFAESKFPMTDDRAKAWMQIAMASLLSHKKVFMTINGCHPDGYLVLTGLQLQED